MKLPSQLVVEGLGNIRLSPLRDYVSQGGQAIIYKVGSDLVAKLYFDEAASKSTNGPEEPVLKPEVMHNGNLIGKLKALMRLKDPRVIAPVGLVWDTKKTALGYTMRFVKGTSLDEAFTNGFWRDNGWTAKTAIHAVESMRGLVSYAHGQNALLADGNPGNYLLVQEGGNWEPRALDVDSWQIDNWPATAFHARTMNPRIHEVSKLNDWFGWGTVACQLLLNVHPYGGILQGYKPRDIEGRMRDGKSIFTAGVSLGSGARDTSTVPPVLWQWMRDTYHGGLRAEPPSLYASAPALPQAARILRVVNTQATGRLAYTKLFEVAGDPVQRILPNGIVQLRSGNLVLLKSRAVIGIAHSPRAKVVRQQGGWLLADEVGGKLAFSWLTENDKPQPVNNIPVPHGALLEVQTSPAHPADRLMVATENGLQEIETFVFGIRAALKYGQQWPALDDSTQWFEGCGIQRTFGKVHLLLPYGSRQFTMLAVPELIGQRPVNAKAGFGTAIVVTADRNGALTRHELSFSPDYHTYTLAKAQVDDADLNVSFRPDGTYRAIWEDGTFTVRQPSTNQASTWQDKDIHMDTPLASWAKTTLLLRNGAIWSLS